MKIKNKGIKNSKITKPKKNLTSILIVGVLIIALSGGILFALSNAFKTETYYVLNQDVPAKTQITSSLLTPVETSAGTAPQNAVSMSTVQSGNVYAKYSLYQGDVISSSNAGSVETSYDGIPDDWSVVSFTIDADNAVNGTLAKGDYFDVIGVNPNNKDTGGEYIITDVLVLDVATASGGTQTTNADGSVTSTNTGATLVYTVGMPQELVAGFLGALPNYSKIHLTRAPLAARYSNRDVSELTGITKLPVDDEVEDIMKGTDPTFTPVVRDSNWIPVTQENCDNGLITTENLCRINGFEESNSSSSNQSTTDSSTTESSTETSTVESE